MAGITDWPMRVLCYRMGADYACSEMVSAIGYLCAKPGNDAYRRLLAVHPEETNTACQLFGRDPVVMGEAAAKVTELFSNRIASEQSDRILCDFDGPGTLLFELHTDNSTHTPEAKKGQLYALD